MSSTVDLRYPAGQFDIQAAITPEMRRPAIHVIAALPAQLRAQTAALPDARLDTPYRPGGWTVRQVVHHVADSHLNAYVRTKLALTESNPTIKPYDQDAWAILPDSRLPIGGSLDVIAGIHERWIALWESMDAAQFARMFHHPELGPVTLDGLLQLYAWHSRHHLAHITSLRQREGW
jgi:hypothetical protein